MVWWCGGLDDRPVLFMSVLVVGYVYTLWLVRRFAVQCVCDHWFARLGVV